MTAPGLSADAAPASPETVREWMLRQARELARAAERLESSAIDDALALLGSCTRLASNALHGGLGVARVGDVAVAVSHSGRTEETLRVVERLRDAGIPVIAVCGDVGSPLAAAADVVLDASVAAEACPLDVLPTAGSTVALGIGDALAMALSARRGWTLTDLARVHPAGVLGQTARERG